MMTPFVHIFILAKRNKGLSLKSIQHCKNKSFLKIESFVLIKHSLHLWNVFFSSIFAVTFHDCLHQINGLKAHFMLNIFTAAHFCERILCKLKLKIYTAKIVGQFTCEFCLVYLRIFWELNDKVQRLTVSERLEINIELLMVVLLFQMEFSCFCMLISDFKE